MNVVNVGIETIKDTVKAFTQEETLEVVKIISDDILWDELIRRNTSIENELYRIEDVLGVTLDNLRPIPIKAWNDLKDRYDDQKTKFQMIRKGMRV